MRRRPADGLGRSFSVPTTAVKLGSSQERRRAKRTPRQDRPKAKQQVRVRHLAETGKPLTTHMWYDGSQHPWEFKRVWHIEPSLTDADTVYAGVEDAGIFRSTDGGKNWKELAGLRGHGTGPRWQPGAADVPAHHHSG